MNVLHVIANPRPAETSSSKKLAFEFFAALTEKNPDVVVNNSDTLKHLQARVLEALEASYPTSQRAAA